MTLEHICCPQATQTYAKVNKRPVYAVWRMTVQDWHSEGQRRILLPYKACLYAVAGVTIYLWLVGPLIKYLRRMFCKQLKVVGESQGRLFSDVSEIDIYVPVVTSGVDKYFCCHLDRVRAHHMPTLLHSTVGVKSDISEYIPEKDRSHVLAIVKYYGTERVDPVDIESQQRHHREDTQSDEERKLLEDAAATAARQRLLLALAVADEEPETVDPPLVTPIKTDPPPKRVPPPLNLTPILSVADTPVSTSPVFVPLVADERVKRKRLKKNDYLGLSTDSQFTLPPSPSSKINKGNSISPEITDNTPFIRVSSGKPKRKLVNAVQKVHPVLPSIATTQSPTDPIHTDVELRNLTHSASSNTQYGAGNRFVLKPVV